MFGESVNMLDTLKQLRSKGSILAIDPHAEGCFIIDNQYEQVSYDKEYKRIDENPLVTETPSIHRYSHAISISKEHKIFLAKAKSSEGRVLNLLDKHEKAMIVDHKEGYIEASDFSADNELVSFGSQTGRTYIYDAEHMTYLMTLPPKKDYISKVCFSKDNRYLLSSCFNGNNVIYDFDKNSIVTEFTTDATLEDAIFIQNSTKVFFILRNGASGIYNIQEAKVEKRANTFTYWPTSIVTFVEDKYVCIGTKSKYLMLFDIEKNELVERVALNFIGISSLAIKGDELFVGFINGVVQVINTAYHIDAFEVAYKINDFHRLHQVVKRNVFLKMHPYYAELKEHSWEETLPRIIELISRNLYTDAHYLAQPYLEDEIYNKIYTVLKYSAKDILDFYQLIDELKIKDAYMKVVKMPLLKYAPPYILLEKKWTTAFLKAKKLISIGITEYKRAYRLLDPFIRIPDKRELVLALINQPQVFFDSEKAIQNQNFRTYFDIIQQYPFLEKTPLHAKVLLLGERYLGRFEEAQKHWELKKMKYYADILVQFPKYQNIALLSGSKLKVIARLHKAIKEENLADIFECLDKYPYLYQYGEIVPIHQAYMEKTKKATKHAMVGDGKGAYKLLKEYWNIPQCHSKVSTIMKLSFFNEMKKYYDNQKVDWAMSIGRYLERFGMDDDIKMVAHSVGMDELFETLKVGYPKVGLHQTAKRVSLLSAKP